MSEFKDMSDGMIRERIERSFSPRAPREVPDNAGRMYLIPSERDDEWDEWCDSGSADVPSWTKPLSENKSI